MLSCLLTTESDKMRCSISARESPSLSLTMSDEASEKISGYRWRSRANNLRSCSSFSAVFVAEDSKSSSILASSLTTTTGVSDELRMVVRSSRAGGLLTLDIQNLSRSRGRDLENGITVQPMGSEAESGTSRSPSNQEQLTKSQPYPWADQLVLRGAERGVETHGDSMRVFTRDLGILSSSSCGAQIDSITVITWVGSIS